MLRVHHLDCGTCCPLGGRLMDGRSPGAHAHLVCHCLAIETAASGLVLVDTGWGVRDLENPMARLSKLNVAMLNPDRDPERAMVRRLAWLGFKPTDVRHIVLTHLDFDHAGGLVDLPHARVHLLRAELDAAEGRRGFVDRNRYVSAQWGPRERFSTYAPDGEPWHGFEAVRDLPGLPPEILLVPLPGHTPGHAAVAVRIGEGWLLHAGDAFFHEDEMRPDRPSCPPGLRFYQRLMESDRRRRLHNRDRLRELGRAQGPAVRILCSHDAAMLGRCQAGSVAVAPASSRALARA